MGRNFCNGIYEEAIKKLEEFMDMDGWVEDKNRCISTKLLDCYDGIKELGKKARESCLRAFEYSTLEQRVVIDCGYFFQKRSDIMKQYIGMILPLN